MIESDNIDVKLPIPSTYDSIREGNIHRKQLVAWLKRNNIKYSLVYNPRWSSYPTAINMRKEDALMFKIVHNL